MLLESIREVLVRDIGKVIEEVNMYENEEDLWILPEGINNSAGTLALHIAGNLQHFIGAVLGDSGYVRNRPAEFEDRNISRSRILDELIRARVVVDTALENLDDDILKNDYPAGFYNQQVSTHFMLVHLHGHLNYHLGQINYHRRLLTK
jgi:hypothetical protein